MATLRQANSALRKWLDILLQTIKLSRWILTFRVHRPLRFLRHYFLIKQSLLFDPSFYLERNPDLPREGMDLLAHYTALGGHEGRDPNPLFDTIFYRERYADVAASVLNPLVHYIEYGFREGRNPNTLFDTSYYLERYPDVFEAGLNPLGHYLQRGALEGRNPHFLFDTAYYVNHTPELADTGQNPLVHYLQHGALEGRNPHPLFDTAYYVMHTPKLVDTGQNPLVHYIEYGFRERNNPNPLFDTSYYLERYPDVFEAGLNPMAHYLQHGALEGRNPHSLFDTAYYVMHNPELADTGQNPLAHYLSRGAEQGEKPNSLFFTDYYMNRYADVAASGLNPLVHYFEYGFLEGRNPNPFFDTAYYLEQNLDVAAADLNPLAHYLESGAREGRKPHPLFDAAYYMKTYPDIEEEGVNPLTHYLECGICEGRYPYNSYEEWVQKHRLTRSDIEKIKSDIREMSYTPVFSVIIPVFNTEERWLRRCLDSVLAQLYPYWELCIADDASTEVHISDLLNEYMARDSRVRAVFREENGHISASSNSALELARGEFIALLDHDDEITIDALYENAVVLNSHPDADMIYSDEDKITEENLGYMPFFKPDWSPDTFLSQMYSGHLGVYRTDLIRKIGGFRVGFEGSQDYDLVLRFTEHTSHIYHIPKILYHWRTAQGSTAGSADSKKYAYLSAMKAIQEALERRGEGGWVELVPDSTGQYRVHYPVQGRPMISIIIPTRDNNLYLDKCLASVFEKTMYEPFEVVILDNGSLKSETKALFDRWQSVKGDRIRIIRMDIPFNYALLNNEGVRRARGDLVCLLNDDTEVITPNWLEELAGQAQRKGIGAVSALLLYPNSTVQHAGVILGVRGPANHSHRSWPVSWTGYFNRLLITANYAAVTGACLMVDKKRYLDAGGLDEDLAVAYNDVDFCLRLLEKGFRNIVLSHVRLYHDESRSRRSDTEPDSQGRFAVETQIMWKRWRDILANDPYYNPNLTRNWEDFSLVTDRTVEMRYDLIRKLFP